MMSLWQGFFFVALALLLAEQSTAEPFSSVETITSSSLHHPSSRQLTSQSIGTFRALVLLVGFTDHNTRHIPDKQVIVDLCENAQSFGEYNIE
jgi:hypothetical protein